MCLPQELPHFNINRMLHHAVAQTSPCCIAAEVLPVAVVAAAQSMLGRRRLCFVFGFKNGRRGLFGSGWAHVRALADNTNLNSNVVKVEKMRFAFFRYPAKKTKPKKTHTLSKWDPSHMQDGSCNLFSLVGMPVRSRRHGGFNRRLMSKLQLH